MDKDDYEMLVTQSQTLPETPKTTNSTLPNGSAVTSKSLLSKETPRLICAFKKLMTVDIFFSEGEVLDTVFKDDVESMAVRPKTTNTLFGLFNGELLEVDTETGEILFHYGKIHDDVITGIVIAEDKNFIWTVSYDSYVKKVQ